MTDLEQLILSLLPVLAQVESNGNVLAVGDGGRAIGIYQIHQDYWLDGIRFLERKHKRKYDWAYQDAIVKTKSDAVVSAYLEHYGKAYKRKTGKHPTAEVLCRIHNSGPTGYKKKCSIQYWNKCKRLIPAAAAESPAGSK